MISQDELTDVQLKWIAEQKIDGVSGEEIARQLGTSKTATLFAYAKLPETPHATELYTNAVCVGEDPRLFEYDQEARPGLNLYEWESRMWRAASICVGCPVMVLCGRLATADERTWTMRGGLMPYQFTLDQSRFDGMTVLH